MSQRWLFQKILRFTRDKRMNKYLKIVFVFLHLLMAPLVLTFNTLAPVTTLFGTMTGFFIMGLLSALSGSYFALCVASPGYLRDLGNTAKKDGYLVQEVMAGQVQKSYCSACSTYQPLRSKHCSACERCVYTYDHHCWWAGTCIGGRNRPYYLTFLFIEALVLWTGVVLVIFSFSFWELLFPNTFPTSKKTAIWEIILYGLAPILIMFAVWVTRLFCLHVINTSRNRLSYEICHAGRCQYLSAYRRQGNPFDLGLKENLRVLLIERPPEWKPKRRSSQPRTPAPPCDPPEEEIEMTVEDTPADIV